MAAVEHLHDLKVLSLSTPRLQKRTLTQASDSLVKAIAELALNCLFNKSIQISLQELHHLKKHWKVLHKLTDSKVSWAKKGRLVKRKGFEFINSLLRVTLTHVSDKQQQQPRNADSASERMEPHAGNMQQLHMRQQNVNGNSNANTFGDSISVTRVAAAAASRTGRAATHSRSPRRGKSAKKCN